MNIHSIETFGTHEGPGIRFVIFAQGCNYKCLYCHNPDSQAIKVKSKKQKGEREQLITKIKNSIPYFGKNGGVTVSGGEPLLQADEILELFKELKSLGIHTALDTNGSILNNSIKELLRYTDLVLLDIKHINPLWHDIVTQKAKSKGQNSGVTLNSFQDPNTALIPASTNLPVIPVKAGIRKIEEQIINSNQNGSPDTTLKSTAGPEDDNNNGTIEQSSNNDCVPAIEFLNYLESINKPVWIRYVLVPGYTDQKKYLEETAQVVGRFKNLDRIEILPYHTLGVDKYEKLGWKYPLEGIKPPTEEEIAKAKKILEKSDKTVLVR